MAERSVMEEAQGKARRGSSFVARAAAATSMGLGGTGLVGWITGSDVLRSVYPSWVSMKLNTALGLVLAGSSLWLSTPEATPRSRFVARACAAAVALLGALTCLEYAGVELGIDQLLFRDPVGSVSTASPGRMAFISTLCFLLVGAALLFGRERKPYWAPQAMATAILGISLSALLGYLYGSEMHLGGSYSHMALHTSVSFLALATGVLSISADRGPMAIATSPGAAGKLSRSLAPALVTIVLGFSLTRVYGERAGIVGAEVGASVLTVASVLAVCVAVLLAGLSLERAEAERDRARAALEERERTRAGELERKVAERTSELAFANRELESFSYSVSHDLRAPLRSISGFAAALAEDCASQLDDDGRAHLERIRGAAERMGDLIEDLLKLSRVHRHETTRSEVDVTDLAEGVVAALRARDPERVVAVEVARDLVATADPGLLRIALENVVGNAWKFTGKRADARIDVGVIRDGGTLFVRDNGAGFDMKFAGKLFTPFQRMHRATDFEGTGVGLATVQRIMQRHGGKVWAESAVGQGTTLFLELPALRVATRAP